VRSDEPDDLVVDLKGKSHCPFVGRSGQEQVPPFLDIGGVALNDLDRSRVDLSHTDVDCESDVAMESKPRVGVADLTREGIEL
jgi:hypothetical protein